MSDTSTQLRAPDATYIDNLFAIYWQTLEALAELLASGEFVVAEERLTALRGVLVGMMLAANGIQRPTFQPQINAYLGESQRVALEKTLVSHGTVRESIVGRTVALTVIYQWYAPQLVARFSVVEPRANVERALQMLAEALPEWPLSIATE